MSIVEFWMNRIRQANPIVAAVALKIATDSALDPAYEVETAIVSKLAEWNVSEDHQAARALRYAIIFYQEDIAASSGNGAGQV